MMRLLIEPIDVLFFRNSKSFGAGNSYSTDGAYLPSPAPVAGAIRSAVLTEILPNLNKGFRDYSADTEVQEKVQEIGTPESYGDFRLEGPFVAQWQSGKLKIFLPTPLDLVQQSEDVGKRLCALRPLQQSRDGITSSLPLESLLWLQQENVLGEMENMAFSDALLSAYLENDQSILPVAAVEKKDFILSERRVGIALEDKNEKDGHLYSTCFLRLQEQPGLVRGFFVETNVKSLPPTGLLKMGGEGKAARYRSLNETELEEWMSLTKGIKRTKLREIVSRNKMIKVYLAAPAVFEQGWLPDFIDPVTFCSKTGSVFEQNKICLKLISAAVEKPVLIGGWDLVKKCPKPMYKAVPGGSVYFFECLEGEPSDVFDLLHATTVLQQGNVDQTWHVFSHIGYGLSFVGTCRPIAEVK